MNRFITKSIALIALVGAITVFTTTNAQAAFIAYICDDAACAGGGDIIAVDEGAFDTGGGGSVGVIVTGGVVAGYEVTSNFSISKPVVGSATLPEMNLTYAATNVVGGSADIWFYASDTDFTGIVQLNVVANAADGDTVTFSLYGGASNANLDLTLLDSAGPLNPPTGDVFLSGGPVGLTANPYSLTLGVKTSGTDATQGDVKMTSVPEPATLSLLGLGLAGLAAVRRRQARR